MRIVLRGQSPAKINWFLHIVGRRADGYHLLESLFSPISLFDDIELALEPGQGRGVHIQRQGDLLHIPADSDLTVKACKRFFEAAPSLGGWNVRLTVKKHIPEQAGLGGGSSNAATVLLLLQNHFQNPIDQPTLAAIALQLGADVPFFLMGGSAFVEGIGEVITPISGLRGHVLVFKPLISCPTQEIFSDPELTRDAKGVKIAVFDSAHRTGSDQNACLASGAKQGLLSFISSSTHNALQTVVEKQKSDWKLFFDSFNNTVSVFDPLLVRMTGSGSAMFAVFASPSQLSSAVAAVAGNAVFKTGQCFEAQVL